VDAVTTVPEPANEPVHTYAPGSPERASLQARLAELRGEDVELTQTIGGRRRMAGGERFDVVEPQRLPDGSDVVTPIVPVVVGDDWKAVLLWRALYDAGVFVNVALHPAVPPAGALLRTSVMATHDRATLDRALAAFADVKRRFEAEHGPLPS
jgi:hypothetical protein